MKGLVLLGAAALAFVGFGAAAADGPPATARHDVVDVYFGTSVTDPYRWMETDATAFSDWLVSQGDYARDVLERLPGRGALLNQLKAIDGSRDEVGSATRCRNFWLYEKTPAGEEAPKLFVRGDDGSERLLIDPRRFDQGQAKAHIDYWTPSWSCQKIAYGVSVAGAEIGMLRVFDLDTGKDTKDTVDRTYYPSPAWLPDDSGFFYSRLSNSSDLKDLTHRAFLLHRLGADPASDTLLAGHGVKASLTIPEGRTVWAQTDPSSAFVVLGIDAGLWNDDVTVHTVRLDSLSGIDTPWRKAADESAHVREFALHGDTLYMSTASGAPKVKVVQTLLAAPDIASAKTAVPEGAAAITDIYGAADGLYVVTVDGGPNRLWRLAWGAGKPEEIPIPGSTGIVSGNALGSVEGFSFIGESWTRAPAVMHYDPGAVSLKDTGLQPPFPIDFSDMEVVERSAVARDGTTVPISIVYKRGALLDGTRPALLDGYGAYGSSRLPKFNPYLRAWFDRGGIYAMAHVRGGGEFGELWHAAGMLATKPNTVWDFIACAEYLVKNRYTSPRLLAGEGRSAGGIMIGGAIMNRPDLFGMALITVGMTNALRFEQIPIGKFNTSEFGSVLNAEGFRMLLAIDAYQQVKDGTPYPAVLLSTGMEDARVSPWQAGKMAASLQKATSSGKPVLLRVDGAGGHFGSTTSLAEQTAADQFSFLLWQAGTKDFQPAGAAVAR